MIYSVVKQTVGDESLWSLFVTTDASPSAPRGETTTIKMNSCLVKAVMLAEAVRAAKATNGSIYVEGETPATLLPMVVAVPSSEGVHFVYEEPAGVRTFLNLVSMVSK